MDEEARKLILNLTDTSGKLSIGLLGMAEVLETVLEDDYDEERVRLIIKNARYTANSCLNRSKVILKAV